MICRDWTLVKDAGHALFGTVLKCRSWQCPECRDDRATELIAKALAGKPTKFLTLTVNQTVHPDPERAAIELTYAWKVLRQRCAKKLGIKKLDYFKVTEATDKGWPHFHILLRCARINQSWLSAQMEELLDSPIVDIRALKSARKAANYIGKYLGKDPHKFRSTYRYSMTRTWGHWRANRGDDLLDGEGEWAIRRVPLAVWQNQFPTVMQQTFGRRDSVLIAMPRDGPGAKIVDIYRD